MKTVAFQMEGLTCPSCIKKIEKVMSNQNGVEEVKVLFHSQKVKITFDELVGTPEEYAVILKKLGYPVQSHKIA